MKILVALMLAVVSLSSHVSAQVYSSAIVFDRGWVGGPTGWIAWQDFPPIGSALWIIGTVHSFGSPVADLLPPSGTYEATYVFEGLSCTTNMWWDNFENGTGGMGACYAGGTLRIYIDQTPDANLADPSTYRDGELVLEASLSNDYFLASWYMCPYPTPITGGYFTFTGGSWFSRVSDSKGRGFLANNEGCFWEYLSDADRQMGYVGRSDGWIDIYPTVSVRSTTWGRIKSMYR